MDRSDPSETSGADRPTRRDVLSAGVASAAALAGLGVLTGSATAWEREITDFRGCSEVWLVVGEHDLPSGGAYPGQYPLTVDVVVDDGDEAVCRTLEITDEAATTIPGQYGDAPVVKYRVFTPEKILGVLWRNPAENPYWLAINDHPCAATPNALSVYDADCVPEDISTTPPGGTGDVPSDPGGPPENRNGPPENQNGPPDDRSGPPWGQSGPPWANNRRGRGRGRGRR